MTRLYNQKKHEQAFHDGRIKDSYHQLLARIEFLEPDVELNDEVDE